MKKISLLLLLVLFFSAVSMAQNSTGDTWLPILNGKFYAYKSKQTGKCGIFDGKASPDEPLHDQINLTIVPPLYDDILLVNVVNQEAQMSSDNAFDAVLNNKHELFDMQGFRLTDAQSGRFGWFSRALGTCFSSTAIARSDGKGYDIMIIMEKPDFNTLITGPFDLFYYTKVDIGDKEYFYIKARRSGTEDFVCLDPLGKQLSQDNITHLDKYYEQQASTLSKEFLSLPKGSKISKDIEKKMYQAALYGNSTIIDALVETYYKNKMYGRVLKWGWGHASNFKCGEALFYAAQCYRMGLDTDVNIGLAKSLYEESKKNGCASANAGLMAIQKIEQPIKVKAGVSTKDYNTLELEELERLANEGDIKAIETFCHRITFYSFGCAFPDGELAGSLVNDNMAVKVLPLLLGAAPQNANCQLMLACVYAGPEAVACKRNYMYSFRNIQKAKHWIEKFATNPKRNDAYGWGYKKSEIDDIIKFIRNIKE